MATMTRSEMAQKVSQHEGIDAVCPHCKQRATLAPDTIRGGEGRLDWTCGRCNSGSSAEQVEAATAGIGNRKINVPRRVTQL